MFLYFLSNANMEKNGLSAISVAQPLNIKFYGPLHLVIFKLVDPGNKMIFKLICILNNARWPENECKYY